MVASSAVAGYHSCVLLLGLMQAEDEQSRLNMAKTSVRLKRDLAAQPKAGQQ
jgi:hypothetical protein